MLVNGRRRCHRVRNLVGLQGILIVCCNIRGMHHLRMPIRTGTWGWHGRSDWTRYGGMRMAKVAVNVGMWVLLVR